MVKIVLNELGDIVTEKYHKTGFGEPQNDILVEHKNGSLRWIDISGNDKNFEVVEI